MTSLLDHLELHINSGYKYGEKGVSTYNLYAMPVGIPRKITKEI